MIFCVSSKKVVFNLPFVIHMSIFGRSPWVLPPPMVKHMTDNNTLCEKRGKILVQILISRLGSVGSPRATGEASPKVLSGGIVGVMRALSFFFLWR